MFNPNLMIAPDVGGKIAKEFEVARERALKEGDKRALGNAMKALNGPMRAQAIEKIYSIDPDLGMKVETHLQNKGEWQRKNDFRDGAAKMIMGGQMDQAPPNLAEIEPHREGIMAGAEIIRQLKPNDQASWNRALAQAGRAGLKLADVPREFDPQYAQAIVQLADHWESQARPQEKALPDGYAQAAQADPSAFLVFQGRQTKLTADRLKVARDGNEAAMQIMGGVHDQASYERAKAQAGELYASHGLDISQLALPDQYNPELVRDLQMQGMDTSKQLQAIARENRLNWDIQDDRADNVRADRNTNSLAATRSGQLANTRRGQDLADKRARDGVGRRGGKPNSPSAATPVRVKSVEEARRLPKGTIFIDPQGNTRRKP